MLDLNAFVSIAGVFLNACLLVFVGLQLRSSNRANREDHDRRKKQATVDFWVQTLERRHAIVQQLTSDRNGQGLKKYLKHLGHEDNAEVRTVHRFLSLYELLAAAANTDVFDLEVLSRIAGRHVIATADTYRAWILERREQRESPRMFSDLLELADRLRSHREK